MQLGSAYWKQQARKPIFTKELAEFNKRKAEEGRQRREEFKKWAATKGKELVEKSQKDYLTTSNDNTWVENRNPTVKASKPKNPHLTERSVKGAKAHRAWEEEHPVLNTWENVLGAVPFAVASAPLAAAAGSGMAALGDAVAATSAGQAITAGLAPLATAASTNVAGAPLYTWADVGLSSLFGGHGVQTAINEGGISPTTALEIAPLARVVKPAVEIGYNAAKPVVNKITTELQNRYPALFDPYTSWDATLGNHGNNIFSRTIGTVGRKYGYTPKAEVPEFHRRLNIDEPEDMSITNDGKLIISSGRKGDGHDGIVNFATSEPARSHRKHRMLSSIDDYIINPKAIGTQNFKSIQPSDTFFETGELAIDPKNITLISGNTDVLNKAKSMGIKTLSSPRLRKLKADTAPISEGSTGLLARFDISRPGNDGEIGAEIQRLASMRGTPTMKDYAYFEGKTGLNSGVIPKTNYNLENASTILGRWGGVRRIPIFNNVVYDPATNIEAIYRKAKIGERPWADYYERLRKMPSARQQLDIK
jgi:hypothetical protein